MIRSIRRRFRRHYLNVFVVDDSRSFYNWHPELSEANPAIPSRVDAAACYAQLPDPEPRTPVQLVHIPALTAEYVQVSIANKAWDDFKHEDPDFIVHEAYWALVEHAESLGFDFSDTTPQFEMAARDSIRLAIKIILLDDETRTKVISHADSGSDTGLGVVVVRHDGDYYTVSYTSDGAELWTHGTTSLFPSAFPEATQHAIQSAIAEAF